MTKKPLGLLGSVMVKLKPSGLIAAEPANAVCAEAAEKLPTLMTELPVIGKAPALVILALPASNTSVDNAAVGSTPCQRESPDFRGPSAM